MRSDVLETGRNKIYAECWNLFARKDGKSCCPSVQISRNERKRCSTSRTAASMSENLKDHSRHIRHDWEDAAGRETSLFAPPALRARHTAPSSHSGQVPLVMHLDKLSVDSRSEGVAEAELLSHAVVLASYLHHRLQTPSHQPLLLFHQPYRKQCDLLAPPPRLLERDQDTLPSCCEGREQLQHSRVW